MRTEDRNMFGFADTLWISSFLFPVQNGEHYENKNIWDLIPVMIITKSKPALEKIYFLKLIFCVFHHICTWFIVLLKYQKGTVFVWFLKLQSDDTLPVWYQHIIPWICDSVIVTEEEVNSIMHNPMHYFITLLMWCMLHIQILQLVALDLSLVQGNVLPIFVTSCEINYTRLCLWKSCCKELASAL